MNAPTCANPQRLPALNSLRAISNPAGYNYLLSQPREAETEPSRRWPLILFLHGAGERGTHVADVARQGLPKLLSGVSGLSPAEISVGRDVAERFVVVAPQCAPYEVWNEDALLRLLEQVAAGSLIDPARVYLSGLSMGGFGVWSLGLRHPARFAALVPICGGGRIQDVTTAAVRHPAALRRLGVWAFHGARDRVVPLEESERMIDALRHAQVPDVRFTVYPETEHDAWSAAYSNLEVYSWLLQHSR